jgi:hypothetical protein
LSRLGLFVKMLRADIVHFHGRWKETPPGVSPNKVVYHYHGDDLRYLRKMVPHRDGVLHFASTPDIVVEGVEWLPNPIEMENFGPARTDNEVVKILHYPDTKFRLDSKGTPQIRERIGRLRSEAGLAEKFQYEEISSLPHQELLKKLAESDILIDQIRPGIYGMIAIEALALGKPVIAHPNTSWYPFVDGNPFFSIDELKDLILHEDLRRKNVQLGIEYVKKTHESRSVIDKLLSRYRDVGLV